MTPIIGSAAESMLANGSSASYAVNHASRIVLSGLSRVNRSDATRPSLDLRIDALDRAGAPARTAGVFRIEVRTDADPALLNFDISLLTPAAQAARFDTVLSQYVLRVEPQWTRAPASGASLAVTVTLVTQAETTLTTSNTIRW